MTVPVTGASVVLGLPPARDWEVLAWEDDAHVIAARVSTPDVGDPTYDSVVRCEAATGACERVSQARSARLTGQLMQRGPPRPEPSSEPAIRTTSMPASSSRELVSSLRS